MDNLPDPEPWLTPADVARHLGIPRNTLYNWLKRGHLRGVKVGRQWRIQASTLAAYLHTPPTATPLDTTDPEHSSEC
jgi:excisionase family DNA binding protein